MNLSRKYRSKLAEVITVFDFSAPSFLLSLSDIKSKLTDKSNPSFPFRRRVQCRNFPDILRTTLTSICKSARCLSLIQYHILRCTSFRFSLYSPFVDFSDSLFFDIVKQTKRNGAKMFSTIAYSQLTF